MNLLERIKTLPETATIGFKYQEANGNYKWSGESDGYTVAELNSIIEDAEKWRQLTKEHIHVDVVMPDHNC